jgi:hypothetical protein
MSPGLGSPFPKVRENSMKLIERRLIGENAVDNTVLGYLVFKALTDFGDGSSIVEATVCDPGETGFMSVEVQRSYGLLEFEAWIEAVSPLKDPSPEDFEKGGFDLMFMWRTPEQEGTWYELEDILASDEPERTEAEPREGLSSEPIPPELLEEEGHPYGEITGPGGYVKYYLVAETFLELMGQPRPSPRHRVRLKSGDKNDLRPANLEWWIPPSQPTPSHN